MKQLFALEIPIPGLLALELNIPGFEEVETWIELVPDTCDAKGTSPTRKMESLFNRQYWLIDTPGRYLIRVDTVVPDHALSLYKLSTRLVPEMEISKDTGVAECEDEIVPCNKSTWCGDEPADDLSLCAQPLGVESSVMAELGNSWGEDHDYFSFTLERAKIMRLESTGSVDTFGVLYNVFGKRLVSADDGGEGENFLFDAALPAGNYFVRVEGMHGAEGDYRLKMTELN